MNACVNMGNVHVGDPRRTLVRHRLRRLSKDMTRLLVEVELFEVAAPERVAHLRRGIVAALVSARFELADESASHVSTQIAYNRMVLLHDAARASLRQLREDLYAERHPHAGVL